MTRILYVGDTHMVPDELEEGEKLIDFIVRVTETEQVDATCFLGDQTHTHGIVHVSVLGLWRRAFLRLPKSIVLMGNHDTVKGVKSCDNTMMVHNELVTWIVDAAPVIWNNILFVPHHEDPREVEEILRSHPTKVAVCHQAFLGMTFGGMLAPDGVDASKCPQETIITGHLHTPQKLGKVWAPGACRWRTLDDADIDRHIWLVDHALDGTVRGVKGYSTAEVCRPIKRLYDTPEAPADLSLITSGVTWRVDITGPADWIESRRSLFVNAGALVRTFVTTQEVAKVKESEGMGQSLMSHLVGFKGRYGTPRDVLGSMLSERLLSEYGV